MSDSLLAYKCVSCGHSLYPRHVRCPTCKGTEFNEFELKEGIVLTYTTLNATPPGVEKPLHLAIAEFDDVRVLAKLSSGEISVGAKVRLVKDNLRRKGDRVYTGFSLRKI